MHNMKAFVIPGPHARQLTFETVAVPDIADDELLVHVKAIGVGVHDSYFLPREMCFPYPIGIEAAGVVARVGASAGKYAVGDRVAFVSMMQPKGGVWADFTAVRAASLILPIPEGMTFEQAAAVPVAGNSTLRALHALDAIPSNGSIFVAGASGAIGTFALQLARDRGWRVAASASSANHDYLRELGAELAVDYRDPQWPSKVRAWRPDGVDGALAVQPGTTSDCAPIVKEGGTIVTVSGDNVHLAGVRVAGLAYHVDVRDELIALMNDIVAGRKTLTLEQIYAFTEAPQALAKVQSRRARGKSVISLG